MAVYNILSPQGPLRIACDHFTPSGLRHTFASPLLQAGVSPVYPSRNSVKPRAGLGKP